MKAYTALAEIQKGLAKGEVTVVQLVRHYLDQIEQKKDLNAFVHVFEQEALERAQEVDQRIAKGNAGKLAGMVLGIKDVLCYKDHPVQAASKILSGFESQFTATAIQRLIDEDVIIIGSLNCDEFAMGSTNEHSTYGPAKNADFPDCVPGGSSGGSAVAVQAGLCLASLGTDTGGSVRQPAAFCDVIGLKPTYSRISRYGLIAYASSFDTIGIFTKNIEDNALLLEIMAGKDDFDSTASQQPVPKYSQHTQWEGKARVAYLKETIEHEGLSPAIRAEMEQVLNRLREEGHHVEPVSFPLLDYVLPTYYILTTAEASSNLSRFDGVRYGYRAEAQNLDQMYTQTRSEGFGEEVIRRILLGTFVLSASYYDAYYTKAQKLRRLIQDSTREIFKQYDFILLPTTPTTAFELGKKLQSPIEMYLADLYTVQASVAGIPSISIPVGKDEQGKSIGLQVMADFFQEQKIFAFANELISLQKTHVNTL